MTRFSHRRVPCSPPSSHRARRSCWRMSSRATSSTEPYAHYTQTDVVPAPLYKELAAAVPDAGDDRQRALRHRLQRSGAHDGQAGAGRPAHLAAVARVLRVSHLGGLLARCHAPVRRPFPPRVSRAGGARRPGVRGLARGAARLCRRGGGAAGLPVRHEHAGQAKEQRQDRAYRPVRQDLLRAVLHARSARPERAAAISTSTTGGASRASSSTAR